MAQLGNATKILAPATLCGMIVLAATRAFADCPTEIILCEPPGSCYIPESTFMPPSGNYNSAQRVSIRFSETNVAIHFRLDGQEPTDADPLFDSSQPITI